MVVNIKETIELKGFIFDVGGVWLKGNFFDFLRKSHTFLYGNEDVVKTEEVIFDEDFNKGIVSIEDTMQKVFGPLNEGQLNQIIAFWNSTWVLDPELKTIVDKLRSLNPDYQFAILSNSDPSNSPNYKKKGWYDDFHPVILSHELQLLKPEPEIYHACFKELKHPPENYLFIDDAKTNIEAAEKLGVHGHHYKNPQEFVKDLKERFGIVLD